LDIVRMLFPQQASEHGPARRREYIVRGKYGRSIDNGKAVADSLSILYLITSCRSILFRNIDRE